MVQFTFINFKDITTMMTTTNTTVFKRMGRILSLVFSDYNEARAFREADNNKHDSIQENGTDSIPGIQRL